MDLKGKMAFYDRGAELENLKKKYDDLKSGELCIVYGRRRLGKTVFIEEFLKKLERPAIYYFVNLSNKKELLTILSDTIFDQTKERVKFLEWEDFFDYLYEKASKEKFIFIMDEFPRIKGASPDFLSKFQNFWDTKLKKTKIMFIAIGSSMSMIYDIFMATTSPLYGRMTWKMSFAPFRYVDFRKMFSELDEQQKIKIYSVFGGTPHFLEFVKKEGNTRLMDIIDKLVLKRTAPLRDEPTDFISMELKKETNYNSILHSIGRTSGSRGEVIGKSGIQSKDLDYYINNLIDLLCLIEKVSPLFYNKGDKLRYRFKDNFFHFWYKYIFSNLSLIELNNVGLLKEKIGKDIDSFISFKFEDIIRELLILYNGKKIKNLNVNFDEIGPWWGINDAGGSEEIEILTNNKTTKRLIVCEVKWTNKQMKISDIKAMNRKVRFINAKGVFEYLVVSKSGFSTDCLKYMDENKITYLNLEDISNLFNAIN